MVARRRCSVGPSRLLGDPLPLARRLLGDVTSMWTSGLVKSSRSPSCSTWAHSCALLLTWTRFTWICLPLSTSRSASR
eukprot:5016342-Pyramimonas_sp.AAC.1